MLWFLTVLRVATGCALALRALWVMYTCGLVVRPAGWGLRFGSSGWAAAPAGSPWRVGVMRGVGGSPAASLGQGLPGVLPAPMPLVGVRRVFSFLSPVAVCSGGPSWRWGKGVVSGSLGLVTGALAGGGGAGGGGGSLPGLWSSPPLGLCTGVLRVRLTVNMWRSGCCVAVFHVGGCFSFTIRVRFGFLSH